MSNGGTGRSVLSPVVDAFVSTDGRGCQGCLVLVFLTLASATWVGTHGGQLKRAAVVGIGVASAAVLAREVLRRRRRQAGFTVRVDPSNAPVPLAHVRPGWAHTAGLVGVSAQASSAPLGGPSCVFYRVVVEAAEEPRAILFEGRSAEELVLEDGADAKIVVKLDGATWRVTRARELAWSPELPSEPMSTYLAERNLATDRAVRARVEWIAPHELVFVRGLVTRVGEDAADYRTSERAQLVMTKATIALEEKPR